MSFIEIKRENYSVHIDEPTIYIDNQARHRSGHMSHAMAEFKPGCFIDFNSNCSYPRWDGHSPYGWVEYRISRDSGKTYSEISPLPYAYQSFLDGIYMISVEKAVACDDGTIVAFCLRNDGLGPTCCEPWASPMVVTSNDEGESWSEPYEFSHYAGRTYDAIYRDGVIYALHFCNPNFMGKTDEHKYRLYTSRDNGKSFQELSVIPFDTLNRGYGTMIFDGDGNLHAYAYDGGDELHIDHAISRDLGKTWEILSPCYVAKGARNPQIALIDGVYILHGRTADRTGFVLYTSEDASQWDEGTIVVSGHGPGFYSNNLNLRDEQGEFLLIQFSEIFTGAAQVNVKHMNLRIERRKS
jgi:hypothetical protein